MKVLLVYPFFPDTYWSFRHALFFEGKKAAFPPLGLLTVSAMLPADWERRLVDMNVETLSQADIEWADMVFVSAMIVQRESLEEVVRLAKALGKKVAVGGPYVSTSAQHLADADYIFVGEAEETLPEFLVDLKLGTTKHLYEAAERPSLLETPVPDFGLIDLDNYSAMNVQYSRGCPFQCEFCDIIEIYGRVPRTKSNAQMLNELDTLKQAGWRGLVFIVDDNFIGNKKMSGNFYRIWSSGLRKTTFPSPLSPKRASIWRRTTRCCSGCKTPVSGASFSASKRRSKKASRKRRKGRIRGAICSNRYRRFKATGWK